MTVSGNKVCDNKADLLIIGAGSGGVRAGRLAANLGKRVIVVEQQYIGGTCVNVGCVPKKLFYYAAQFKDEFAVAESFGWNAQVDGFSWDCLRENKNREIERLNLVYKNSLQNSGVILLEGSARLLDHQRVDVSGQIIHAEKILIATGGRSFRPEIPGGEFALVSDDVFSLPVLPEKIIIVGGGYIALEFASIFNALGVETELDYRGPLFLKGFDDEVRRFMVEELENKGITLRFNSQVKWIEKIDHGQKRVHYQDGGCHVADQVLFAMGRVPNTVGLGLENTQIELATNGAIKVSENFQTSVPSIYALGDVIARAQLTPVALAEAGVFVDHLYGQKRKKMNYELLPTAVFSNPTLAMVGLTEEQARSQFKHVDVYRSRFKPMKHSLSSIESKIFMKMIVNRETDQVLGVHMVGEQAGEIIQGLAVALNAKATKAVFDTTLGIHPTLAEEFVTMRSPG